MSAEIRAWFEKYRQRLHEEGRTEGRQEGRQEGERLMLLKMLRARFGDLPSATVTRIEAAAMPDLERWAERLLRAQTLADVLDDPS